MSADPASANVSAAEPGERLAALLHALIARLRARGGFTWDLVRRVTTGRVGFIELDGHRLRLEASAEPYVLEIEPLTEEAPLHFRADGATLLEILRGRLTLDRAMVEGRVHARAGLEDLLGIYLVVMSILADGPVDAEIRRLLAEWEATWPYLGAAPALAPLEEQGAEHNPLVHGIPDSLLAMTELMKGAGRGDDG
jgi:hypothetical protein